MSTMTTPRMPQPGDSAPDLELVDDEGRPTRLSEARGRWIVLYFYPKDDTPGCTIEACEFRDADGQIRAQDAEVWGVSILGSGSKAAFKRKFGLPFRLLADEDHAVAEAYGTWVEKENYGRRYWGVQRATFLIDPEGTVRRVWPKVRAEGHAAEVVAALAEERENGRRAEA
ncbi:MAG TPA: peroxiredoxin [Candidatus Caenarcaniphilales bacterium]|nr:peroxiredoxin [Candidatus Caenarcaniphilales bacterium]